MDIILASASPRRVEILRQAGIVCQVIPSDAPEESAGDPEGTAKDNALRKALTISPLYPRALIVAADTVVVVEGKVLGKPRDAVEAEQMLSLLSGRWHDVITGVALCNGAKQNVFSVVTAVKFRSLSDEDVQEYAASGEPLDKAGAYGIQGLGGVFVEEIKGCYYNVVGLPLPRVMDEMQKHFSFCLWQHRKRLTKSQ